MTPSTAASPKIDCAGTAHGPKPKEKSCAPQLDGGLLQRVAEHFLPVAGVTFLVRIVNQCCVANSPMKTQLHCARYSSRRSDAQLSAVFLCRAYSWYRVKQLVRRHRCAGNAQVHPQALRASQALLGLTWNLQRRIHASRFTRSDAHSNT